MNFNPRPPCGGRHRQEDALEFFQAFQSTPPVWGATPDTYDTLKEIAISIHAPRVGGDPAHPEMPGLDYPISIHAPRVGGDVVQVAHTLDGWKFQSTPPVWGATVFVDDVPE